MHYLDADIWMLNAIVMLGSSITTLELSAAVSVIFISEYVPGSSLFHANCGGRSLIWAAKATAGFIRAGGLRSHHHHHHHHHHQMN